MKRQGAVCGPLPQMFELPDASEGILRGFSKERYDIEKSRKEGITWRAIALEKHDIHYHWRCKLQAAHWLHAFCWLLHLPWLKQSYQGNPTRYSV